MALLVAEEEEGVAEGLLDAVELDADGAGGRGGDGLRALVLRRRVLGDVHLLGHLGLEGLGALDWGLEGGWLLGGCLEEGGNLRSILLASSPPLGPFPI